MNGILEGIRQMLITCIAQHTFTKLVKYFDERRIRYEQELSRDNTYMLACIKKMRAHAIKAKGHRVTKFNTRTVFCLILTRYDLVRRKGGNTQIVNLAKK